jgi:DNA repair photolyase
MAKIDSLFPILDSPNITPLARRAAGAPLDSEGHLTEYRPLESRSILSRLDSARMVPFTHAVNPYRGCEFGCRYCYARYTHEFLEFTPEEFERKIYFKQNAAWLLEQELRHLKPGTHIAIGTATDCYQPLERRQGITRSLLEVFARHRGFILGIVTKSALIARDIDLLQEIAARNAFTVNITVTTMNPKLARLLEPRAPRPDLRIRTLKTLREAGLRAGVLCSPLMPGITDTRPSIDAVARAAAAAGAQFFYSGALFLKPCSQPTFLRFVSEHFPGQLDAYKKRYEKSAFVSSEYKSRVKALVDSVRKQYGFGERYSDTSEWEEIHSIKPEAIEEQASLPFA